MKIPCPQCRGANDATADRCCRCNRSFDDVHVFGYTERAKRKCGLDLLAIHAFLFAALVAAVYLAHGDPEHRGLLIGYLGAPAWFFGSLFRTCNDLLPLFRRHVMSQTSLMTVGLWGRKTSFLSGSRLVYPVAARKRARYILKTTTGTIKLDRHIQDFEALIGLLKQYVPCVDAEHELVENAWDAISREKVYRSPWWATATLVVANLFFWGIVATALFRVAIYRSPSADLWVIPGFLCIALFSLYFLCVEAMKIAVSAEAVSVCSLWGRKTLPFNKIDRAIWQPRWGETGVRLEGAGRRLFLSGGLNGFMELIQIIRMKHGLDDEDAQNGFPLLVDTRRFGRAVRHLLPAFSYGAALYGMWLFIRVPEVPNAFALRAVLLVASLLMVLVGYGIFWYTAPETYVFEADSISVRKRGCVATHAMTDLEGLELASVGGVRVLAVHLGGKRLILHPYRLDVIPEALYHKLHRLYPSQSADRIEAQ